MRLLAYNDRSLNAKKPPLYILLSFAIFVFGINAFSDRYSLLFYSCSLIYCFACFVYVALEHKRLTIDRNIIYGLLFIFWISLSALWQKTSSLYSIRLRTVISIFIFCAITVQWLRSTIAVHCAYVVIVLTNLLVLLFRLVRGDLNQLDSSSNSTIIGSNELGLALVLCSNLSVFLAQKNRRRVYYVFAAVFSLVALLTGSRKTIVGIVLILIVLILVGEKRIAMRIRYAIVGIITIIALYFVLTRLTLFSYTHERFELLINYTNDLAIDYSAANRDLMRSVGWEAFVNNPILGYGVTYSTTLVGTYLHDNFVELGVSLGVIGLLVFYLRHFYIMIGTIRLQMLPYDRRLMVSSLLVLLLFDYGSVTYFDKFIWLYITILMRYLEVIRLEYINKERENANASLQCSSNG